MKDFIEGKIFENFSHVLMRVKKNGNFFSRSQFTKSHIQIKEMLAET